MDTLYVDFETYYAADYSLSKMQTDAYIKDSRFEIIGVSVAVNDMPPVWYTGTQLEIVGWLRANFDWENCAVCCHNTLFDGFILSYVVGVKPKLWMDTLSMGRMVFPYLPSHSLANLAKHLKLKEKGTEVSNAMGLRKADMTPYFLAAYAEYCRGDTEICRDLCKEMLPRIPALEIKQIDMVIRMFTEPQFHGDVKLLEQQYATEVERKRELLEKAELQKDIIMSNAKFAEHLITLGVTPPTKVSSKTGKTAFAFAKTDKEFQALLECGNDEVEAAVAARLGVKTTIAETRVLRLKEMAERGPLPVYLNFWGAKTTGRLSGGNQCLTGDTHIVVLRPTTGEVLDIQLFSLRPDDLVWDGTEFVSHGGLAVQGYKEVITYAGVTGTADHRVYCEGLEEPVELGVAAAQGLVLQDGGHPGGVEASAPALPER